MPQPDPKQMTNNQSPITNNQFFVLLFRLDPQRKAFVIGEWLLVNGYLSLADSRGFGLGGPDMPQDFSFVHGFSPTMHRSFNLIPKK
jgi:hypothetical protein